MPPPLPTWLTQPATIFTLVLFVLSTFVSLFSTEIRRGISKSVDRSGTFLDQWRTNHYRLQLGTLERLHGNAYELLLYLAAEFVGAVVSIFRLAALYIVVVGILSLTDRVAPTAPLLVNPISLVAGALLGKALTS